MSFGYGALGDLLSGVASGLQATHLQKLQDAQAKREADAAARQADQYAYEQSTRYTPEDIAQMHRDALGESKARNQLLANQVKGTTLSQAVADALNQAHGVTSFRAGMSTAEAQELSNALEAANAHAADVSQRSALASVPGEIGSALSDRLVSTPVTTTTPGVAPPFSLPNLQTHPPVGKPTFALGTQPAAPGIPLGQTRPALPTPPTMSAPVQSTRMVDVQTPLTQQQKIDALRSLQLREGAQNFPQAAKLVGEQLSPLVETQAKQQAINDALAKAKGLAEINAPDLAAKGYVKPIFKDPKTGEDIDLTETYGDDVSAADYKVIATQRGLMPNTGTQKLDPQLMKSFDALGRSWAEQNMPEYTDAARNQLFANMAAKEAKMKPEEARVFEGGVTAQVEKAKSDALHKQALANQTTRTNAYIQSQNARLQQAHEHLQILKSNLALQEKKITAENARTQVLAADGNTMTLSNAIKLHGEYLSSIDNTLKQMVALKPHSWREKTTDKDGNQKTVTMQAAWAPGAQDKYNALGQQLETLNESAGKSQRIIDQALPGKPPVTGGAGATGRTQPTPAQVTAWRQQYGDTAVRGFMKNKGFRVTF